MSVIQKPENYEYYDDAVGEREMTVKWQIAKIEHLQRRDEMTVVQKEEE
jgi:hypothetical protein